MQHTSREILEAIRDQILETREERMDRTQEFLISTFNDGVNNMYSKITVDRWYDENMMTLFLHSMGK